MLLQPGDPAPHFKAATPGSFSQGFGTVAGRHVLLAFLPLEDPDGVHAVTLEALARRRGLFEDERCCVFAVLRDPALIAAAKDEAPGFRWVLDADGAVSLAHGALAADGSAAFGWLLLDPDLRVLLTAPYEALDSVMRAVAALPSAHRYSGADAATEANARLLAAGGDNDRINGAV